MKYLFVLLLSIAFVACQDKECSQDSACRAFTPPVKQGITCTMQVEGYYYDSNTKTCLYYSGDGCSQPPFELKKDCLPCLCE